MTTRSRVVLVVDDSIGVQTAAREALRSLSSVEVVCHGDVDGAEAWLERGRPDVALCDVVLPDRSGYELCRGIKAGPAVCPVLLLSSPFETFDESEALACGSDGVLGKPFTAAELRSRVEKFLLADGDDVTDEASGDGLEGSGPEAAVEVLGGLPGDDLAELSEADVVTPQGRMTAADPLASPARELLEPLAERLAEPLFQRLMNAWENGDLPPAVERYISQAAERLVRQRLQELEDEATEVRYGPEEAD